MKILFVIPGDINLPTGGYRYDREIIKHIGQLDIEVELLSLEGDYPFPSRDDERDALRQLENLPYYDAAIIDGLAGGAMPNFIQKLSKKMSVIALIHHPLCLETGLDKVAAKNLQIKEHEGLQYVSKIITTSEITAQSVCDIFNQPHKKLEAILPGVRDIGISTGGDGDKDEIKLLCVASVITRKNHTGLFKALFKLTSLNWHLDCIGMTNADETLYANLQTQIKDAGLDKRITFHSPLEQDALDAVYLGADVFVLPSLYEGYGMVYAEAIMCGLPIIATNAGAIPDTVPQNCGILVDLDDEQSLTAAIREMISNAGAREQFKQACLEAKSTLPTWEKSAKQLETVLKGLK